MFKMFTNLIVVMIICMVEGTCYYACDWTIYVMLYDNVSDKCDLNVSFVIVCVLKTEYHGWTASGMCSLFANSVC